MATSKEKETLMNIWSYLDEIKSMNKNSLLDAEIWLKDKECSNISSTKNEISRLKTEVSKIKKCLKFIEKQYLTKH